LSFELFGGAGREPLPSATARGASPGTDSGIGHRARTQAELAELAKLTPARVTQIMNLLGLAPDIQEEIFFLPPVTRRGQ
jgi:hypothetical protein